MPQTPTRTLNLDLGPERLEALLGECEDHNRTLADEALALIDEALAQRQRILHLPDGFPPLEDHDD